MTPTHDYRVALLDARDLDACVAHLTAYGEQWRAEGGPPSGPYGRATPPVDADVRTKLSTKWSTPLTEPGWGRTWGLWCESEIVGEASLQGGRLETGLHRATLGIALQRAHRGRGMGRGLMQALIEWAREQPSLFWIDLGVFEGNDRAHAMYRKLGFVEFGRKEDCFRVDGVVITDIEMCLALR